jgi:hypothetical protein
MKKIWIIALLAIVIQACSKHSDPIPGPPPANQPADTIILDTEHPANPISPQFQGLSFETWLLARNPGYLNANNAVLIQLLKNLGGGVLRIGGNSSDETGWTGKQRRSATGADSLTTSDIDRLAAFSRAIGWPVIFGLNLGTGNVATASDEAVYTYNTLNENLYAFQIGNEPDYFKLGYRTTSYTASDYQTEWNGYFSAIRAVLPQAQFAGPDVSDNIPWLRTFAGGDGKNINLIDAHYYVDGPATKSSIDCHTILSADWDLSPYLQAINTTAIQNGIGYRITETNSIWGGGKAGVSDAFAGTLWALDLMWTIAENNGQGINFHGGDGLVYSPVSNSNGVWTANPVYYGMLAFKYAAAGGTVIPVTTSGSRYSCSAHACTRGNNTYSITLINKEQAQDIYFTLQTGKTISNVSIDRLSAPSLTSKTNVTFAGSAVGMDGTFIPGNSSRYTVNKKSFVVKVPAGSAAVVNIN